MAARERSRAARAAVKHALGVLDVAVPAVDARGANDREPCRGVRLGKDVLEVPGHLAAEERVAR